MEDLNNPKAILLSQAKTLGITVDKRWSAETLAEKVMDAQREAAAAEADAFDSAKKMPVLLLRDAWPLADERHNAGETIDVPIPLAKQWIAAGVAERADPMPGE